ncbi:MAG: hypothetical protein ACYC3W_06995 [Candidatus Nanopelagicales bacterium]
MLGTDRAAWLLVTVVGNYMPNDFTFVAVNGGWRGKYTNGQITVYGPNKKEQVDPIVYKILTDDQNRLRGDSRTVFANIHNPAYVAPLESENTEE